MCPFWGGVEKGGGGGGGGRGGEGEEEEGKKQKNKEVSSTGRNIWSTPGISVSECVCVCVCLGRLCRNLKEVVVGVRHTAYCCQVSGS